MLVMQGVGQQMQGVENQTEMELDLFNLTETELIRVDMAKLRRELSNVRRGLFARHEELLKMYCEAKDEIEVLKKSIKDKEVQKSPNVSYFAYPSV